MTKLKNNLDLRHAAMLNNLFELLDRSLARYLINARPWSRRPYLLLGAIARRLATEHEYYAGELARLLHHRGENVKSHTYPMEFTYYNYLSLEHLAPRLLDHQNRLIDEAHAALDELPDDYEARRVIGKLVRSLRKYGSLLAELLAPHRLALRSDKNRRATTIAGGTTTGTTEWSVSPTDSQTAA
jgi:hypothetical protein